jgi:ABC-type nitrate/sulfonate/bicarbonate transport system ATPase subunit
LLGNEIVVLSQAPARIVTHENINEPAGNRSMEEPNFKKLKQILLNALGQSD